MSRERIPFAATAKMHQRRVHQQSHPTPGGGAGPLLPPPPTRNIGSTNATVPTPAGSSSGGGGLNNGGGSSNGRTTTARVVRRKRVTNNDNDLNINCLVGITICLICSIFIALYILWNVYESQKYQFGYSSRNFSGRSSRSKGVDPNKNPHLQSNKYNPNIAGLHSKSDQGQVSLFPPLKESTVYKIPNTMSHIGDKSDQYATLRKQYDSMKSPNRPERSVDATQELHTNYQAIENPDYNIYNCPDIPPPGYPYQWKTLQILNHWNPHNTDDPIPDSTGHSKLYQGLCQFSYQKDYLKILKYRSHEVPYVVRDDPHVAESSERWNFPGYMNDLLGSVMHRAEYSKSNHFLYWMPSKKENPKSPIDFKKMPENWKEPTTMMRMTYADWVQHANVTDPELTQPDKDHWYFRLIGCGETGPEGECDHGASEYLFDELPFFQPKPDGLYLVESDKQKGVHCRFGMTGIVAENHFDSSRNSIVVLKGKRRYILSSPDQCRNFALFPKGHPSARHSQIDWSNPDLEEFPEFGDAYSNEVVLQAGDVLYLPTNWFHYIVSLNLNYQCNTRSGTSNEYWEPIHQCGF